MIVSRLIPRNELFNPKVLVLSRYGTNWNYLSGLKYKSTLSGVPLLETAFSLKAAQTVAFTDHNGQNFNYAEVGAKSLRLADELKQLSGPEETRVAFLVPRDIAFPTTFWATWISGNVGKKFYE